jgi:hypothetical protein
MVAFILKVLIFFEESGDFDGDCIENNFLKQR